MNNNLPASVPISEQAQRAREHYEELATLAHHWSSVIPQAIDAWEREKQATQRDTDALKAAEQCMADLVEVWERGAGRIVLEQAVYSVKDDGLKKVRKALKAMEQPAPAPALRDEGEYAQMFTTHILTHWSREQIEPFCLHLLGDAYQEQKANAEKLGALVPLTFDKFGNLRFSASQLMVDEVMRLALELAPKPPEGGE